MKLNYSCNDNVLSLAVERAQEMFSKLDTDNDGDITEAEFIKVITQHLTSLFWNHHYTEGVSGGWEFVSQSGDEKSLQWQPEKWAITGGGCSKLSPIFPGGWEQSDHQAEILRYMSEEEIARQFWQLKALRDNPAGDYLSQRWSPVLFVPLSSRGGPHQSEARTERSFQRSSSSIRCHQFFTVNFTDITYIGLIGHK